VDPRQELSRTALTPLSGYGPSPLAGEGGRTPDEGALDNESASRFRVPLSLTTTVTQIAGNLSPRSRLPLEEAQRLALKKEAIVDSQPSSLIEASRVRDTKVFNAAGEKLGVVNDLMIDKRTGQTIYAVVSFGGFLGLGEDYFPIPWAKLKYDDTLGGYVTDIETGALEGAPAYAAGAEPHWGEGVYEEELQRFYGANSVIA
jgi:sporulation protein YlmC with PRC-barrel domain